MQGYRVEAERLFHRCGSLVWSLYHSPRSREQGAHPESRLPGTGWMLTLHGPAECWWLELGTCWHCSGGAEGGGLALNLPAMTAWLPHTARACWSLFILLKDWAAGEPRRSATQWHLPPLHTPVCSREQGGCCEGPSGDLSPQTSRLHTTAQRRFCAGWHGGRLS